MLWKSDGSQSLTHQSVSLGVMSISTRSVKLLTPLAGMNTRMTRSAYSTLSRRKGGNAIMKTVPIIQLPDTNSSS